MLSGEGMGEVKALGGAVTGRVLGDTSSHDRAVQQRCRGQYRRAANDAHRARCAKTADGQAGREPSAPSNVNLIETTGPEG